MRRVEVIMGKGCNSLNHILDAIEYEEALKEVEFRVCCEASMAKIREVPVHNDTSENDKFLAIRRIIFNGDLS